MTHTRQYADDEGEFKGWTPSDRTCPRCGVIGQRYWRLWESHDGAYEDEQNVCRACGHTWWVDGIDS